MRILAVLHLKGASMFNLLFAIALCISPFVAVFACEENADDAWDRR